MNPMDLRHLMDTPGATDRCTATARTSGVRCKRWPVPGARVCRSHGGAAPQVRRMAAERVDFERLIAVASARSPHDVMAYAVVVADALLAAAVQSGGLAVMAEAAERAARVARMAIRCGPVPLTDATVEREIARLRADLDAPPAPVDGFSGDDLDRRIAELRASLGDETSP
jgi:hypothetical protein